MNQHPCGKPGGGAAASSPSLKQLAQLAVVGICVGTGVCGGVLGEGIFSLRAVNADHRFAARMFSCTQTFKRKEVVMMRQ